MNSRKILTFLLLLTSLQPILKCFKHIASNVPHCVEFYSNMKDLDDECHEYLLAEEKFKSDFAKETIGRMCRNGALLEFDGFDEDGCDGLDYDDILKTYEEDPETWEVMAPIYMNALKKNFSKSWIKKKTNIKVDYEEAKNQFEHFRGELLKSFVEVFILISLIIVGFYNAINSATIKFHKLQITFIVMYSIFAIWLYSGMFIHYIHGFNLTDEELESKSDLYSIFVCIITNCVQWAYILISTWRNERDRKIFRLCSSGHKSDVKELEELIYQKVINSKMIMKVIQDGNNLLHIAVNGNNLSLVQLFVNTFGEELDPSIQNESGYDVFDLAVLKENLSILKLLLRLYNPSLRNLKLTLETSQPKLIQCLVPKLLKKDLVYFEEHISNYCKLVNDLQTKSLSKQQRKSLEDEVNQHQTFAIEALNKCMKGPLSSQEDKTETNRRKLKIESEFKCLICIQVMKSPLQIYACSFDHLICSNCIKNIKLCPECKEDFIRQPAKRRLTSERILSALLQE